MNLLTNKNKSLSDIQLDVLRSLPIFSTVSDEEQNHAFCLIKVRKYRRGEVVYHQDDPPGSLFVVVTGAVKMERTLDNGRQHTISWITKGQLLRDPQHVRRCAPA